MYQENDKLPELEPIKIILSRVDAKLTSENQWQAICPVHGGKKRSLSMSVSDDNNVLLHCHRGCSTSDVCAALGLSESDLFADNRQANLPLKSPPTIPKPKKSTAHWKQLAQECVDAISTEQMQRLADELGLTVESLRAINVGWRESEQAFSFPEHDSDGNIIGLSLRAVNGSKRFVKHGHRGLTIPTGWRDADGPTLVVEGASDVAAAMTLGLRAIGRPSNTGGVTLLTKLLDGQDFIVIGENDEKSDGTCPGLKGAMSIATGVSNAIDCSVRYAMPPVGTKDIRTFLCDSGVDISDITACHEAGQRLLESIVDASITVDGNDQPRPKLDMFRPFPVEVLPEPIRSFVTQGAKSIGCDTSYLVLPLLSALASAIGNTRRIELKHGWTEPSIIWAAFIGESGTKKSPPVDTALRAVRDRQKKATKIYKAAFEKHENELREYDKAYTKWKRTNTDEEEPVRPPAPVADRCLIDDATVEALAVLLQDQPRGLLMVRDELASWFGGMDRYSGGKGSDASKWLEMFGGRSMQVDRKGGQKNIYVERAAVSLCGGIQPNTLRRSLSMEYRENGLAARILMAYPPAMPRYWTEYEIDRAVELNVGTLFDRLYELQPDINDEGYWLPHIVILSPDGKKAWVDFYDEHAKEQAQLTGDLAAVWSKLEGYAARLALVIHMARAAANDPTLVDVDEVDEVSMAAGITIARWFGYEAQRIYSIFSESDDERTCRKLIELIQRKGENITARELQQSSRRFDTAEAAEKTLCELVKDGYGQWMHPEKSPKGGRSKCVFRLFTESTVYGTPKKQQENIGCVDVDNVDEPQNDSESADWGEL